MNAFASFWSNLDGPIHPQDEDFFRGNPPSRALFQLSFVPSAFFGDVSNARVILCFGNGGSEDDQEFYQSPSLQAALLAHIRDPSPVEPERFFRYFKGKKFSRWIADGDAVFVNAVPYRSKNMKNLSLRDVRQIPSVRVAHLWIQEKCRDALNGKCLVVFHRPRLWGTARANGNKGVVFSSNPASPHLSAKVVATISDFLG